MELEPISRESLKGMYSERLAEERKRQIDRYVQEIYSSVRGTASSTTKTSFTYQLPNNGVTELIPDIVSRLRKLFEDSKVEHIEIKDINRRTSQMEIRAHVISVDWS